MRSIIRIVAGCVMLLGLGCSSGDPAAKFIAEMEAAPPEKRVPNWERTKALMAREAPAVGEAAPDFTLKTPDGQTSITRSTFQAGKPLVLMFGSFT